MEDKELQSNALSMLKAIDEDRCAEINGREYKITAVTHDKRRKVFAFYSRFGSDIQRGDFWFLTTPEFADVEKVISNIVTFEGSLLSKLPNHWDEYPEDYLIFIPSMLGALSYPFLRGNLGG
jgi:hypothetical protein